MLIRLFPARTDELYGIAEFQPGQEEPAEVPISQSSSVAVAPVSSTSAPAVVSPVDATDFSAAEGFTILQKGLFFAVILGCVAAYLKMGSKKQKRFQEKSMA